MVTDTDAPTIACEKVHKRLLVRGRVQGVGFRPWVWRIARELGMSGSVSNDRAGVTIEVCAPITDVTALLERMHCNAPPLVRIDHIESLTLNTGEYPEGDFIIAHSSATGRCATILPDIATCSTCIAEMANPSDRRHRYPFINCIHCGPRLSIQKSLPWDRQQTTMATFAQCNECAEEYADPGNRRFHAQPNACPACGPQLHYHAGDRAAENDQLRSEVALQSAIEAIRNGQIIAIKATGGWQLCCDAMNPDAIARLREQKRRIHKPFALMARDCEVIGQFAMLNAVAHSALAAISAPIVLLDSRTPLPGIAPGLRETGWMLPHSGLHHLLCETFNTPLVMTSGNLHGEPQIIDDALAYTQLAGIADGFLGHDRAIAQRVDDSVLRSSGGTLRCVRAGRGISPLEIPLATGATRPCALGMGAHMKNTIALGLQDRVMISQHVGDLDSPRAHEELRNTATQYLELFGQAPEIIAVDLHPDYASTRLGEEYAKQSGARLLRVQHHHAHMAACLLEHGIEEGPAPVLGIVLDGMGLGTDQTIWGGEFLLGGYAGVKRVGTFKPVAQPGGSLAARQPWRNLLAHLHAELGNSWLAMNFPHLDLFRFLQQPECQLVAEALEKQINAPLASSCGRLFDAVAAAVGIRRQEITYEGQAAMELEASVDENAFFGEAEDLAYPFSIPLLADSGLPYIEPVAMWQALLGDLHLGTPTGVIAARFHRGLARAIVHMAGKIRTSHDNPAFDTVTLCGGVFQNRWLAEETMRLLGQTGLSVLLSHKLPAGDGGISAGQVAIAMHTGRE